MNMATISLPSTIRIDDHNFKVSTEYLCNVCLHNGHAAKFDETKYET